MSDFYYIEQEQNEKPNVNWKEIMKSTFKFTNDIGIPKEEIFKLYTNMNSHSDLENLKLDIHQKYYYPELKTDKQLIKYVENEKINGMQHIALHTVNTRLSLVNICSQDQPLDIQYDTFGIQSLSAFRLMTGKLHSSFCYRTVQTYIDSLSTNKTSTVSSRKRSAPTDS